MILSLIEERSHTADEYIYISEIENGISGYIQLLETTIAVYWFYPNTLPWNFGAKTKHQQQHR